MTNERPIENKSIYEWIGGAPTIQRLVDRFYLLMDTMPEVKALRSQHQMDLTEANYKLNLFLTGWTGGPPLYMEKFGHPRLRARHLPFKIGLEERDQWLMCMFKAMEECQIPEPPATLFRSALYRLADHMRNQQED